MKKKFLLIAPLLFFVLNAQSGSYEDTMAAMKRSHQNHMNYMNNMIQQSRNRELQYQRQNTQQYNQIMRNYSRMMPQYGRAGSAPMYPGTNYNPNYNNPGYSGAYPGFAPSIGNAVGNSVQQGIPQGTTPGRQEQPNGLPSMNIMGIEAPSTDGLYVRDPRK